MIKGAVLVNVGTTQHTFADLELVGQASVGLYVCVGRSQNYLSSVPLLLKNKWFCEF